MSQCAQNQEALEDTVRNVFAKKTPATLAARFSSISLFLGWARCQGLDISSVLPPTEDIVYKYMEALRNGGGPPTRAKSTLAAFNFLQGIVGFRNAGAKWESPRVLGYSERSFARKRRTMQTVAIPCCSVMEFAWTCVDQHAPPQLR